MHVITTDLTSAETFSSAGVVPRATALDTARTGLDVFLPTLAKGVIVRRRAILRLAEWMQFDRRAIRRMQDLRARYGTGPLLLSIPGRSVALIFDPAHVHRILAETPQPFTPASKEKIAALSHFEPQGVLLSKGSERADRRRYNEEVLEPHAPLHHLSDTFAQVVDSEIAQLHSVRSGGVLSWQAFSQAWFRIVRRVIFGDAAREDKELIRIMFELRKAGNWPFLAPRRTRKRERLHERILEYLRRAEPKSLAGAMAHIPAGPETAPEQQVPQWLFAFDAAGMATFRTLALLATHREYAKEVRRALGGAGEKRYLKAAVLESVRLWPTTPLLLRESTAATEWEGGVLPADTAIVIFTPFFHRDNERLPYADRFAPELWQNGEPPQNAAFVPFSEGAAACPGRELVLMLSSALISSLLSHARLRLLPGSALKPGQPIPATLSHFHLRFELRRLRP